MSTIHTYDELKPLDMHNLQFDIAPKQLNV